MALGLIGVLRLLRVLCMLRRSLFDRITPRCEAMVLGGLLPEALAMLQQVRHR